MPLTLSITQLVFLPEGCCFSLGCGFTLPHHEKDIWFKRFTPPPSESYCTHSVGCVLDRALNVLGDTEDFKLYVTEPFCGTVMLGLNLCSCMGGVISWVGRWKKTGKREQDYLKLRVEEQCVIVVVLCLKQTKTVLWYNWNPFLRESCFKVQIAVISKSQHIAKMLSAQITSIISNLRWCHWQE